MTTLKIAVAAMAVAILVAGCGNGSSTSRPRTTTTTTTPAVTPVLVSESHCPPMHPAPLVLYPETEAESTIVRTLVGCMDLDGLGTYFENRDPAAVWTIDRPAGVHWLTVNTDLKVQAFREVMSVRGFAGITIEPGQSVMINAAPKDIHLALNPQVQTAWQTLSLLADVVPDPGLNRLLSNGSLSRKATVDCLYEGFRLGTQLAQPEETRAPEDIIETGLGLHDGAKTCAKSIKEARAEGVLTVDDLATETKAGTWRASTKSLLMIVKSARGVHFRL